VCGYRVGVSDQGAVFAVDPDELAALGRVLDDTAQVLGVARGRLAGVRAEAPGWAADGDLPIGVARLLEALDWAVSSAREQTSSLSVDLIGASRGYRAAEDASRSGAVPADRDANTGSRR